MKEWVPILSLLLLSCSGEVVQNNKDMEQNMMDLKIYQENLGDQLKNHRLQDATWLLDGTDSILQLLAATFREHRKLDRPFSYFYDKKMKAPIEGIRNAIAEKDTATALKNYRLLVNRCNGCHVDHDVDKEVRW